MIRKNLFAFTRFQIIVLLASLGLWGCVKPVFVIPTEIKAESPKDSLLAKVSVTLKNAEGDSSEYKLLLPKGRDLQLRTNKHTCADMIVQGLNKGLKDRGARIEENALLVVSVDIPQITFNYFTAVYRAYSTVNVTIGSGWRKTYQGEGGSEGFFHGLRDGATRALNESLSHVVTLMLTDEEFLSVLKAGK